MSVTGPVAVTAPGSSALAELGRLIPKKAGAVDLLGLPSGAAAYALAQVASQGRSLLILTPSLTAAEALAADLSFFLGSTSRVAAGLYPTYAHLPFSRLPAPPWTVAKRMRCLWLMSGGTGPAAVVAPIQAALHRTLPRRRLTDFAELLLEGEETDRAKLVAKLAAGGYSPTALVEEPGDLAVRGGIVDVFGPHDDDPVRLEFFGDHVDSLRLFKPADQRSIKRLKETVLLPMSEVILDAPALERGRQGLARLEADPAKILALREPLTTGASFSGLESFLPLFYDQTQGLWDYLDQDGLVCFLDPAGTERAARDYLAFLEEHCARLAANDQPHLPLAESIFAWEEVEKRLELRPQLHLRPLDVIGPRPKIHFQGQPATSLIAPPAPEESVLGPLIKAARSLNAEGRRPWLVCRTKGQIKRLTELLAGHNLIAAEAATPPSPGLATVSDLNLVQGVLTAGFALPDLVVFTEEEALGQAKVKAGPRQVPPAARLASYAELNEGDLVVHVDHGIGRFLGLVNLAVDGQMGDFLFLEYRGEDKLYLPATRLELIQKYAGPEGQAPALDKLGGETWIKTKRRIKRKLLEIVRELVDLYALRQVKEGFAFSGRDEMFREFEATFDFDETPDQATVIEEVLADMQRSRPMDRLVCGDVGYGKTEVALRAGFRAVLDGKQVALLVPTTVLAEQHGATFSQRLRNFPLRVEVLSRFKTAAEQKAILADLEKGKVDIIIGTHRLLSKDVIVPNLGLLIIDEEHRFGVVHKEKLKDLRQTVDVLALTATPIPRTLQMSLFTIRDLSVINTPPQDRQAITTYLSPFDPAVIQEAIGREMARSGQVFFVHNRVQDINRVANLVQKLVPTARVEVAHGQMSERVLERVMHKFVQGEVDVLVCTTIIESGLDIPAANTIIVNNADKLGLAQIYQLRGRVGRSAEQAFAYLLIPEESTLTRDAQKRLKVLMDFTHLGAGFQIAMHDLQIRGGGNLLGHAQSGNVAPVGYEMYLSLLEQAVSELKGQPQVERLEPELHLPFSAFIPSAYVPEPNQRLVLYRRLSGVDEVEDLEELTGEMVDRFGPLPEEVRNLVEAVRLKMVLRRVGVSRLDATDRQAALTFAPSTPLDPARLVTLVRSAPKRFRLTPEQQLLIHSANPLAEAERVLKELLASCKK